MKSLFLLAYTKVHNMEAKFQLGAWLLDNWIEVAGVVISLVYLSFSVRQKIWLWPFGILSALFYIVIYYDHALYADMSLQFYYVIISIYGWFWWKKRSNENTHETELKVRSLNRQLLFKSMIVFLLLWAGLFGILANLTDSDVPVMDALTTAGGIVATWMLARKYIENWLLWIFVDGVSIFLYLYKELYATAILFLIYTLIAVFGYRSWKQTI